jgi:hypothetical protein
MSIKEEMEEAIGKALREVLNEIPGQVKRGMSSTVAKALGFENRWRDGWEVDHCNGRMSIVGELVSSAAQAKVREAVMEASKEFTIPKTLKKAIMSDMKKVFSRAFRDALSEEIEELARQKAQEMAKQIMSDMANITMDIPSMADPSFGEKEIEKAALEAYMIVHGE